VGEKIVQAREYQGAMSDEDKRYLIGVFEPEIRELERMLGWDCSRWLV